MNELGSRSEVKRDSTRAFEFYLTFLKEEHSEEDTRFFYSKPCRYFVCENKGHCLLDCGNSGAGNCCAPTRFRGWQQCKPFLLLISCYNSSRVKRDYKVEEGACLT